MCVCADIDFEVETKRKKIYFFSKSYFFRCLFKTPVPELSSWFTFPCESEVLWLQWLCVLMRIFAFISSFQDHGKMCSSPDAIYMSIQRPKWYLKIVTCKLKGYRSVPADDTHAHNPKGIFLITYPYLLTQYGFDLLSARSTSRGEKRVGELGHDVMQNKLLTAFIHVSQCRHRVWESVHAQNNLSHFSKLTFLLFLAVNRAQSWKACSNYELSEQNKTEKKKEITVGSPPGSF